MQLEEAECRKQRWRARRQTFQHESGQLNAVMVEVDCSKQRWSAGRQAFQHESSLMPALGPGQTRMRVDESR